MTTWQVAILLVYGWIVVVWPIRHLVITFLFATMPVLSVRSPRWSAPDPPPVTAIIPAKDEEATIADCLASVRAQSYPNLEILVVDDRSTDATARVVESIAASDPRVRLLRIHDLPDGWTGKTHALHVAAKEASGEWLWFIDADTRHAVDSLSIVLEDTRHRGAALASLLLELRCETYWERALQPLMGIVLMRSFPLLWVNRPRNPLAFANGQYILIERSAYDSVGGHEAVRDRFVEDINLARLVKRQGSAIRVSVARGISSTRMYTSLSQIIRGWSRILYDAVDRRVWPLALKMIEPAVFTQTVFVALPVALGLLAAGVWVGFARWLLALAILHLFLQISVLARMYRFSSRALTSAAWSYPIAVFVSDWILLKSIGMCLTGRVTWRGTAYGPSNDGARPANDEAPGVPAAHERA